MTICISVKVGDCLVFAADSATSLSTVQPNGQAAIIKVFNHGNKVFNLFKGLPICAMTCGLGNFGDASIATLAKDFRLSLKSGKHQIDAAKYTIQEIAEKAYDFFYNDTYGSLDPKPSQDHSFEFWIGGYSAGATKSEVWKVQIVNGACAGAVCSQAEGVYGLSAGGQPEAFNRLVLGYSQQLPDALKAAGVPDSDLPKLLAIIQAHTRAVMCYPSMPVQDAIRLADYLVDATKGFVGFVPGADTVGGDTDIAVVTKHEGFKWIRRKHYYTPLVNPLETDHV
jgi:hypothetical protein